MKALTAKLSTLLYISLLPLWRLLLGRSHRAYVLITHEGKILLIKNWVARDTWRLPGGGVHKGEDPLDAALREVKEELRLVLSKDGLRVLDSGVFATDNLGFAYTIYIYQMTTQPRILPNQEIRDWQLFSEIPENTIAEVARAVTLYRAK